MMPVFFLMLQVGVNLYVFNRQAVCVHLRCVCVCVCRCVYSAAVWYHNHLAGMMDIVMITEDRDAIAQYGSLNAGVYVISVQVRDRPEL